LLATVVKHIPVNAIHMAVWSELLNILK